MPNFLAMSFDGELAPSFDLRCIHPGRKPPDGWGIGYYPGGELSASILKESAPPSESIRSELVKEWEHLASSVFLLHIRTATWGRISDADTQPFTRSFARRDWSFAHAGSLEQRLEVDASSRYEPVGSTDTERVFCSLMTKIAERGWRSLGDIDARQLRDWLDRINDHGVLSVVLSDGRDIAIYADRNDAVAVHLWEIRPPYGALVFGDDDLQVDLTGRGSDTRTGVVACTEALNFADGTSPPWRKLAPGHLAIVRQGAITAEISPADSADTRTSAPRLAPGARVIRPIAAPTRTYDIVHRTRYRYEKPVERSRQLLRLTPAHDRTQTVHWCSISLSVDGQRRDYEDVFGNTVNLFEIETPYTELVIDARSRVEVCDHDLFGGSVLRPSETIPVVWMPWQRHMLQPLLLPPELPESELVELVGYAMSFVERNDGDLVDTLLDINASIHAGYAYRQGSTTLATTAYEVYAQRRGVCQDFTNLFICLARLLGVPARYVCGYLYTGPKHENQAQGEASHAWVQVYLPKIGWHGLDPTNGIVAQTQHVRVATGRNYVDATPTSGTIFVGGGREQLSVDVRVEPVGG